MSDYNSQQVYDSNIISNVALVLESVIRYFQTRLPGIPVIYDENLGFDTGARLVRDYNNLRESYKNSIPAIFFRRSVLRPQEEGISRRSVTQRYLKQTNESFSNMYRNIAGVFDFEFMFVTSKMSVFENFEIAYINEAGLSNEKELVVSLGDLGDFTYYMKFNPLDDKTISSQGNFYKSLNGVINIRGNYISMVNNPDRPDGLYHHIKEISKKIYNSNNEFLEGEIIK